MREPLPAPGQVFGVLAEFNDAERLLDGARQARAAGYTQLDSYTPFPIEGLAEILGFREQRIPWLTLIGGVVGALAGFGMQAWANWSFPIDIGNRPLIATTAFMLITFELLVLGAVFFCIGAMLGLNRLPRLHHPLFDVEEFRLASADKFFLLVLSNDVLFSRERVGAFLQGLGPVRVSVVPHTEQPE